MEKKITKLQVIEMMLADVVISNNEIYKKYLEHERDLLVAKKNAPRKTKANEENEGIKKVLLEEIAKGKGTISDFQKRNAELAEYSNQKLSALLRQLFQADVVVKATEKGKTIFSIK